MLPRPVALVPIACAIVGALALARPAAAEPVPAAPVPAYARVPAPLLLNPGFTRAGDAPLRLSPRRTPSLTDWTEALTHRLSLRQLIETTPVVVGGVTVYLEAEPVATRQRPNSGSQLTFAFAPDRVLLLGAF